ncbi:MAG: lytic transglycosylase domain-containing protein [Syntrophobacterales bacterium]|nr:MAG: lytic transglycosylase domain-containing protein [Syntrophobacterales bacterium]
MDRHGYKKVCAGYPYSLLLGIILLAIIFPLPNIDSPCYGGIYRYIDENGNYHFTNCPRDPRYQLYIREKGDPVSVSIDPNQYDHMIEKFSKKYDVDSALVKAIMRAESGFNSYAISRKGAKGLMQLMPKTAAQWSVVDVFDPMQNIEGGVRHLKHLLDTFGDNLTLSIAAYNAGKNAVIQNHSIPPYGETRNFVREVLRYYESYKH